jgi:hypothetical protein
MLRVGAERSTALQRRLRETAGILPAVIAQREIDRSTHVMGVARFERFFRTAARLDVDKQDLKRFSEFINHKIYDLLLRAEADPGLSHGAAAARSRIQRRHGGSASLDSGWTERRARAHVQNHRPRSEEPRNQALGALLSDFRPAFVI